MGTHMPYGITQCYLPPSRGDIPALTPAEAGTRVSDPGGMQGWVDLVSRLHTEIAYPPTDVLSLSVARSFSGIIAIHYILLTLWISSCWHIMPRNKRRIYSKLLMRMQHRLDTRSHTHTHLTALCLGIPGWAGTRKAKPVWILLKQVTLSGNGISWAIWKTASRSILITMPAPHHSVFYRPDALPVAQPTAWKHWRHQHRLDTVAYTRTDPPGAAL